ncbi:uncharacterized protein [Amphiura filiformis]|uniref:uncharacterized protein n=1 Tax=Amphiura filiformis TaxID=82378 RepID=UPI003B20E6AC
MVDNSMLIKRRCLKKSILLLILVGLFGYCFIWVEWTRIKHRFRPPKPVAKFMLQYARIRKKFLPNSDHSHGDDKEHTRNQQQNNAIKTKHSCNETCNKQIILLTTNSAYLDVTDNWLESFRRIDFPANVTVIAEDSIAFKHLSNRTDVHVVQAGNLSFGEGEFLFNSKDYKTLINKRPQYVLKFLTRGFNVLFSDVDTVLLANPFDYFDEAFDMFVAEDQRPPEPTVVCAGFVYYRATNATIKLVKSWIENIKESNDTQPDQIILNLMIRKRNIPKNIKIKYLDPDKFISGKYYFNDEWRKNNSETILNPVMVHNNWMIGHDKKVKRFRKHGLWFVDYTITNAPDKDIPTCGPDPLDNVTELVTDTPLQTT